MSKTQIIARYINLFTDWGFRRIFGRESNKKLLISFLNCVLAGCETITELEFLPTEHVGASAEERRVVFDIQCKNQRGERFIVELQRARQTHFRERTLYYSTFAIQEQGVRGEWDYSLKAVYVVSILDFLLTDLAQDDRIVKRVSLCDSHTGKVWYDKLTFLYIEVPRFTKQESELETIFDKWLYAFRHLHQLQNPIESFREPELQHLLSEAEIPRFNTDEDQQYKSSLTEYEKMRDALDYAKTYAAEEGRAQGLAEGRAQGHAEGRTEGFELGQAKTKINLAIEMSRNGISWDVITKVTGVHQEDIQS